MGTVTRNEDKPEGAEIKYCSRWFKFGRFGKLFVWRQYQWELSTVEHHLILAAIKRRDWDRNRDRTKKTSRHYEKRIRL